MVHANARLTPAGRLLLCQRLAAGRPVAHVASELGISRTCAYRWWARRYQQDGPAGLHDRPSTAHTHPRRLPASVEDEIARLRRVRKLGPARIAMSWLRSCSVSHGLRPAPGRSPSPSSPSALNRLMRSRTVWGWQWSSAAIWLVRAPAQLRVIIRARAIQSPGAWRLTASLRTARSSAGSWGGRADNRVGAGSPGRWQEATKPTTPIIYSQSEERSTNELLEERVADRC